MPAQQLLDIGNGFGGKPVTAFSCSKLKLDNLFLQWFSIASSQQLVVQLLDDVKQGRPLSSSPHKRLNSQSPYSFSSSTPPLSPKKGTGTPLSPFSPSRRSPSTPSPRPAPIAPSIPQFYFPQSVAVTESLLKAAADKVDAFFAVYPQGLSLENLKSLLRQVFGLPSSLAYPLFYKLVPGAEESPAPLPPPAGSPPEVSSPRTTLVSRVALLSWLHVHNFWGASPAQRLFDVLRAPGANSVTHADIRPVLAGILVSHPGLEFLQDSPEFQDRYAETVIYRIFYALDRAGAGGLGLRELARGDVLEALAEVEACEDINRVTRYFSYEHFYVIYCKFWDLDGDHDFALTRDDLLRYGNHALTFRIVDRVFGQCARRFASGSTSHMGYQDFVWFILSEEDKTTDTALEYWFRAVDLDGDGVLSGSELLYFYEEQLHRMECLSQESVAFTDVMSQMHDMLNPDDSKLITLRDLRRNRALAGNLFNILFNLNKFIAFETRDPFVVRQEREEGDLGDWDRFARSEYARLAVEEDGDAEAMDSGGGWGGGIDADL